MGLSKPNQSIDVAGGVLHAVCKHWDETMAPKPWDWATGPYIMLYRIDSGFKPFLDGWMLAHRWYAYKAGSPQDYHIGMPPNPDEDWATAAGGETALK